MDPITAAIIGVPAVLGGLSSMQANRTNRDIGMLNYYQQRQARQDAISEADQQRYDARLGVTDAAGNRTHFIPGVGWVTDLTDTQRGIQEGSEREQLREVTTEADRNARASDRAEGYRNDEAQFADAAQDELRRARRPDESALYQMMLAAGQGERNRMADRSGEMVATMVNRRGGDNGALIRQSARATADQESARDAGARAMLMAGTEADNRFNADRDSATGMYDYFRRMSTSGTAAPRVFTPQGPQRPSTGVMDQGIINAKGRSVDMPYVQPNLAGFDTISDLGLLYGAFKQSNANKAMDDNLLNRQNKNVGG